MLYDCSRSSLKGTEKKTSIYQENYPFMYQFRRCMEMESASRCLSSYCCQANSRKCSLLFCRLFADQKSSFKMAKNRETCCGFNSLWSSDAMSWQRLSTGNDVLPDGTKPLRTFLQWGTVTITWGPLQNRYLTRHFLELAWIFKC